VVLQTENYAEDKTLLSTEVGFSQLISGTTNMNCKLSMCTLRGRSSNGLRHGRSEGLVFGGNTQALMIPVDCRSGFEDYEFFSADPPAWCVDPVTALLVRIPAQSDHRF